MGEIWKDVIGYEGLYQVSSLGNVKSLSREMWNGHKFLISKDRILTPTLNTKGYPQVRIYKKGIAKTRTIHQLVAESFLNHTRDGSMKLVVDHINDVKTDNRVDNLQIVTNRFNVCKTQGKYTSKYKGVHWYKRDSNWRAAITIDNKNTHLGYFNCELAASLAYQTKLKEITNK